VQARGYGLDLNDPVSAPLTNRGAYGLAQQAADLQYAPQLQANESLQRSVPIWYANYQADVAAQQATQKAYAAPLLQQAQQGVTNAGAMTAPGLDPSSPQYATEQQAAKGRQSIAQLGADTLAAIPAATYGFLGGQATTAARELPGVRADLKNQYGVLEGQRGAAVAKSYGDIRQNEQNANIAYGTLGLNSEKAAADAAADVQTSEDKRKQRIVSRKNTRDRVAAQTQRTQDADAERTRKAQEKAQEKADKETAAKKAAIDTATGKVRNNITDVIDYQQNLVGQQGEDRSQKPDINGNYPTRKVTQKDIDNAKVAKYGMLGRIAIAVREGRPLTQEQIDYLHQRDKDLRIPREWIVGKPQTDAQKKNPHSTSGPAERAPGKYGGHI
jgi:hypothetical protein